MNAVDYNKGCARVAVWNLFLGGMINYDIYKLTCINQMGVDPDKADIFDLACEMDFEEFMAYDGMCGACL